MLYYITILYILHVWLCVFVWLWWLFVFRGQSGQAAGAISAPTEGTGHPALSGGCHWLHPLPGGCQYVTTLWQRLDCSLLYPLSKLNSLAHLPRADLHEPKQDKSIVYIYCKSICYWAPVVIYCCSKVYCQTITLSCFIQKCLLLVKSSRSNCSRFSLLMFVTGGKILHVLNVYITWGNCYFVTCLFFIYTDAYLWLSPSLFSCSGAVK